MSFLQSLTLYGHIEYFASVLLVLMAIWGLIHFFPRKDDRGNYGAAWLILAIWLGFLGNGLNALMWQVMGDPLLFYEVIDYEGFRHLGGIFGDVAGKGLAALSIYLHFYARWATLDDYEKPFWRPMLMGYYPDRNKLIYRLVSSASFRMNRAKRNGGR